MYQGPVSSTLSLPEFRFRYPASFYIKTEKATSPSGVWPFPLYQEFKFCLSAEQKIMIACPVSKNRRIDNLTTGAAFPRVESTNKVIILFSIHSSTALGTFHSISLLLCIGFPFGGEELLLHVLCQKRKKLTTSVSQSRINTKKQIFFRYLRNN